MSTNRDYRFAGHLIAGLLAVLGGLALFEARVAAECKGSDCEQSDSSAGSPESDAGRKGDSETGESAARKDDPTDVVERARELRDRAMELMDEEKQKALDLFDRALELHEEDALAWANRGTVLLNLGRHEEALASYEKALELRPDYAYAQCSMASVHNATGQPRKAIEAADRALEIDPEFAPAYLNKARALEAMGEEERAEKLRERAIELDPSLEKHVE